MPPELTGLWAGDWVYQGKVVGEIVFTIHPCGVTGTEPVDVGCGHSDFRTPPSTPWFQGCIVTMTYEGRKGDAFVFLDGKAYDWGNERCALGRSFLTPMPDGTLDVTTEVGTEGLMKPGGYATLNRVGASSVP